jgi:hypothetical protein
MVAASSTIPENIYRNFKGYTIDVCKIADKRERGKILKTH